VSELLKDTAIQLAGGEMWNTELQFDENLKYDVKSSIE
jgi:hypothetical protein